MSEQLQAAVAALFKLNPHPGCHARARWVPEKDRYDFPIYKTPLTEDLARKHIAGKLILGAVASDQDGKTNTVGLDVDAHLCTQKPGVAVRRFVLQARALDVPVVVHSSKSGNGAHVRTLFSEKVPAFLARAMYIAIVLAAGLNGDAAIDKVWPPSHGLGVLALPYNSQCAKSCGGTMALNGTTLQPLARDCQVPAVLDTDEMNRREVETTLRAMGLRTESDAAILSGQARVKAEWLDPTRQVKDGVDGGIQHMMRMCDAVARLRDHATAVSYEFWFGLMTNFRPFIGGYEIFTELSALDSKRFDKKALDRSWKAIAGGPRLCQHLDAFWDCPRRGSCPARSPAGLPFAIRRAERGGAPS